MPVICIGPVCIPWTFVWPALLLVLRPIFERLPEPWQQKLSAWGRWISEGMQSFAMAGTSLMPVVCSHSVQTPRMCRTYPTPQTYFLCPTERPLQRGKWGGVGSGGVWVG